MYTYTLYIRIKRNVLRRKKLGRHNRDILFKNLLWFIPLQNGCFKKCRSSHRKCSIKTSQYSQENTCVRASF